MRLLLLLIFILPYCNCFAQPSIPQVEADSLWQVWKDDSKPDSSRLKAIDKYTWKGYLFSQPDSAFYYAKLEYEFAKERGLKNDLANPLNTQGASFFFKGDYANAIDYYTRSLMAHEKAGNRRGMANPLLNIGSIYKQQGDHSNAIDYYNRALEIMEETEDRKGEASCLNNIGTVYNALGNYSKAMDYYKRSIVVFKEVGHKKGIANSLANIGNIYRHMKDYTEAIDFCNRSLDIAEEVDDKQTISYALNSLGKIYAIQKDYKKALEYSKRAIELSQEVQDASVTRDAAKSLWKIYKNLGNHEESLEMHELFIEIRDSILSEENEREVIRHKFKYEYEKQAAADSIQTAEAKKVTDAQLAAQEAQLEQEETQRYALYGGLALLFLFGGFMYNRFRVTKKQKSIIQKQKSEVEIRKKEAEHQREIVEEKNREITDSITYAKRIQNAILPPKKIVEEYLPNSFIIYKPKDIVAGDFYWMEQVEDTVLFAAADCTGHGVPGAMVSVVCNNGLNRSVREYDLSTPGEILDKTREIVVSEFEKSDEDVKDGMDISLCTLNYKTRTLKWAGANNPIWIIRDSGSDEAELIEIKPNKQPIGVVENPLPFTTHELELMEGDTIYIFTDGFQDQFGGEKGKKFKPANFKRLLLSVQSESLPEQQKSIDSSFENWKGDLEQLDDVCVIGVKI